MRGEARRRLSCRWSRLVETLSLCTEGRSAAVHLQAVRRETLELILENLSRFRQNIHERAQCDAAEVGRNIVSFRETRDHEAFASHGREHL